MSLSMVYIPLLFEGVDDLSVCGLFSILRSMYKKLPLVLSLYSCRRHSVLITSQLWLSMQLTWEWSNVCTNFTIHFQCLSVPQKFTWKCSIAESA